MKPQTTTLESTEILSKKGTCIEFFSAYQNLEVERMLNLFSADAEVFFEPLGEAGFGKVRETGNMIWAALMDCFPDLDNTVKELEWDEETQTVKCKVAIFGTQKKDFMGLPNKGLRFDSDHIFIFRFNDQSNIDRLNILWNHENFVKQLQGSVL